VTSVLLGASSVDQLDDNLDAVQNLAFDPDELRAIDEYAKDSGINIWSRSSAVDAGNDAQ
jgi:L-glyceraldehyde 3-phosphate reductase